MPEPPELTALYRLYNDSRREGGSAFLQDLYPRWMHAWHYLGTAGSCSEDKSGYYYCASEWESDCLVTVAVGFDSSKPMPPRRNPKREVQALGTALYRLRNNHGDLLYVGISGDPLRRWIQHAAGKGWWPEVCLFAVDWFESREQAAVAEAEAIRSEYPAYNVMHNA